MTGYALQDDQATDGAAAWPSELDEQLISEILNDDSLLGALQVPGESEHHCSGDTGPDAAPAQCNGGGDRSGTAAERKLPQPAAVTRALCSVYSGPTIQDIEKALSSRPRNRSNRRYSPIHLFGAASTAPGSKCTTKVRSSCSGKTPSDGFKWRKYGQKRIKNNPYPRSYYKCTSSRCGAKKHVEKSVDDPEVLVVTYQGPHLHDPQPPFPRRQWPSADFLSGAAAAAGRAKAPSPPVAASGADRNQHTGDGAEARGCGGAVAVAGDLRGRQNGLRAEDVVATATATRSCDGGSIASVAAPSRCHGVAL